MVLTALRAESAESAVMLLAGVWWVRILVSLLMRMEREPSRLLQELRVLEAPEEQGAIQEAEEQTAMVLPAVREVLEAMPMQVDF